MPNVGPLELAVVLIIALIIFGPKRLPELGKSLGNGIREFKDSVTSNHDDDPPEIDNDYEDDDEDDDEDEDETVVESATGTGSGAASAERTG